MSAFGPQAAYALSTREDGMEQFINDIRPWLLLSTLIYAIIGMLVFGLAFALFNKLMPFSVRKEIEEDQNTALGIVIGAFLIGLSIIIAAAIV